MAFHVKQRPCRTVLNCVVAPSPGPLALRPQLPNDFPSWDTMSLEPIHGTELHESIKLRGATIRARRDVGHVRE